MKAILPLITFLLLLPDVADSNQFKVTEVYDGNTVKAESHDVEITKESVK